MRKKTAVLCCTLAAAALLAGGCSKSVDASDKAVSVAKQAIEVVDQYLDGETDGSEASDKLDELKEKMEYVDDMPTGTSKEKRQHTADSSVATDIFILSADIVLDKHDADVDSYDELVSKRNELAEKIGEDER